MVLYTIIKRGCEFDYCLNRTIGCDINVLCTCRKRAVVYESLKSSRLVDYWLILHHLVSHTKFQLGISITEKNSCSDDLDFAMICLAKRPISKKRHAATGQYRGQMNKHHFELNILKNGRDIAKLRRQIWLIFTFWCTASKLLHTDFMASNGNRTVLYQVIASNYGFKQKDKQKIFVCAPTSTR